MKATQRGYLVALATVLVGTACLAGTRDQARETIFPEFKVEKATPDSVFKNIRALSEKYSPQKRPLNFVYMFTPAGKKVLLSPTIDMELSNISAEKLIEYVCMATGLKCRFEEKVVMIGDSKMPAAPMETRVYRIAAGVVDPQRTRPRAKPIDGDDDD
jgi:hypothetical protein